ncbi:MAG: TIM-barrel domain-containing protein, partial [Ktedonobacterales bacterium]
SWAVARDEMEWPIVKALVATEPGRISLTTPAMRVEIATAPFRVSFRWPDDDSSFAEDDPEFGMGVAITDPAESVATTRALRCVKRLAPTERIVGAGVRTSGLDARGEHIVNWNTDPPQPHGDDTRALYTTIPFWMGLRDGRAYGVFLDSVWQSELDFGATDGERMVFGAAGGDLTYYVFAGPTPAAILARYADLTGHMPLPPRWALGYGQSRWSYFPEEYVREVAAELRARRIPCDSLWLDIDYMDGYRVFTWSPRRFPDPPRLLADLRAQGFQPITIIDPGVKADPTDPTFAEGLARGYFVRRAGGALFTGNVWPGDSAFPDFSRDDVRQWWGERHRDLLDAGVAGIWDDMNEPSLTDRFVPDEETPRGTTLPLDAPHYPDGPDAPPLPHRAFHNAYGMQMARATFEGLARGYFVRR